jgi:hypothetical protein
MAKFMSDILLYLIFAKSKSNSIPQKFLWSKSKVFLYSLVEKFFTLNIIKRYIYEYIVLFISLKEKSLEINLLFSSSVD